MEGKLYTAQEIFDAMQTATENLYDTDDTVKSLLVAKIGADIAYGVTQILKFDEKKTLDYCKKKLEDEKEEENEEGRA